MYFRVFSSLTCARMRTQLTQSGTKLKKIIKTAGNIIRNLQHFPQRVEGECHV